MAVTILEGSTFCLSDEVGDLHGQTGGFFAEDTRFLSRFTLTINGERPLLLSSGKVEYFSAAFYMRNPLAGGHCHDLLPVSRRPLIREGPHDMIALRDEGPVAVSIAHRPQAGDDIPAVPSVQEPD